MSLITKPTGPCDWSGCKNEASHLIRDMAVKPVKLQGEKDVGDVRLCPRHYLFALNNGRVLLDWDRVLAHGQ